jgi:hypothetical protein
MERKIGNFDGALELYRETILAFRHMGQIGAVAHQLECFGFIALAKRQNERALQLFAAASILRTKDRTPMTPDEQAYYDQQLAHLRQNMDKHQFETEWSTGANLSIEDAIELAVQPTQLSEMHI